MTEANLKRRKARNGLTQCRLCEKEIQVGDEVLSKRISRGKRSALYHKSCAEEVWII